MEYYQLRVIEEKKQLDEKIKKLELFLGSHKSSCLSDEERYRMVRQRIAMFEYSGILSERIEAVNDAS